eukprot:TRINITY_DN376_c0_g1_i1.p1 TRINITY_DN376_c0_g1~~TRINITY_DN376_c0_g1_i1.p1  ORF type:complete len:244 (-),score=50.07 TRINITY_DN376_c0_g1_i1:244-975(-)
MNAMSMGGGGPSGIPPPAHDKKPFRMGAPGCPDNQRSPDEVRIIQDMVAEEIDNFLQQKNFDGAAARALKNETPYVVLSVLDRGPLRDCTNPSGALVARIRDAKQRAIQSQAMPAIMLDANSSELDRFLAENRIDQSGIAALRREPIEVQQAVMSKGPLVNTTNTSASLMARIRIAKEDIRNGGNGMGPGPPRMNAGPMGAPMGGMGGMGAGAPAPGGQPNDQNLQSAAMKAIQQLQLAQNQL